MLKGQARLALVIFRLRRCGAGVMILLDDFITAGIRIQAVTIFSATSSLKWWNAAAS